MFLPNTAGDPLHNVLFYDKSGELVPQQSYLEVQ